jgi:PAS domain S-box-containing protein
VDRSRLPLKTGNWRSYDGLDGLDHDCRCVVADAHGYVWVGSRRRGVSRFDGSHFETFGVADGLPHTHVRCLALGGDGALWIGTEGGGLARHKDGAFASFGERHGLADGRVRCVLPADDGTVWVGTRQGLFRFDGDSFRPIALPEAARDSNIRGLLVDDVGSLWVAASSSGLYRYRDGEMTPDTSCPALRDGESLCLAQDHSGHVWVGTRRAGIFRRADGQWARRGSHEGLPLDDISCLRVASSGDLWIGAHHSGLVRYDGSGFHAVTTRGGLAHNYVHDIAEDREGSLWFACWHGGLSRYREDVELVTDDPVQETMARDHNGRLLWASGATAHRTAGSEVERLDVADRINDMLVDRDGGVCLATAYDGVWRHPPGAWSDQLLTRLLCAEDSEALTLCEGRDGGIWIGTDTGAYCCVQGVCTRYGSGDGMANDRVSAILEDSQGVMWFGSNAGGLTRYDGSKFDTFSTVDGLPHDDVSGLSEDSSGVLWVATRGGVSRYNGSTFVSTTRRDGLMSTSVKQTFQDSVGRTWAPTLGAGVHVMRGRDVQVVTTEDGLPSNHVTAVLEDGDGRLLFATYRGICRYTPRIGPGPIVAIVSVDDGSAHDPRQRVTVPQTATGVSIRFRAVSPRTSRVRYRYRLNGHDDDWAHTWDDVARYVGLPKGSYTFRVEAFDRDLCRSPEPATVDIDITGDPRDQLIAGLEETIERRNRELQLTTEHAEDALRHLAYEERVHETLMTASPDALFVQDADGRYVRVNDVAAAYLRVSSPSDAVGKTAIELLPTEEGERRAAEDREIISSRDPLIGAVRPTRGADGASRWYMFNKLPVMDPTGEVMGLVGIGRDITDFVRAEERLHEREVVQAALLEAVPDSMFRVTAAGRVVDTRVSIAPGDAYPLDIPESLSSAVIAALSTGTTQVRSYVVEEPDGSRYYEARYTRIDHREALALVRDVTEATRIEAALRESEEQRSQLLQRLMTTHEDERARIAYELHDQAAQAVASLMFGLRAAELVPTLGEARAQVSDMRALAATVLEDLRELSTTMRPSSLDDLGLMTTLRRDAETISADTGANVTLSGHDTEGVRLSRNVEIGLYRVVQHALANAAVHADAANIAITVRYHGDRVSLIVEDDGMGFDADAVMAGPAEFRFGFLAMEEHMRLLGGEMSVHSEPGEGAVVLVEAPIDPIS